MTPRPLASLLAGAGVTPRSMPSSDPPVKGLSSDSRRVASGDLFFALRGLKDDGVRHAGEAVARGAAAIVAESKAPPGIGTEWVEVASARLAMGLVAREWFGRPDEAMTLVGVTGTKGKTTVTYLVESIAAAAGRRAGRIGTVGVAYGGRETTAERTTPEATDLYRLLAAMRDAGTDLVAMEVSSHALVLDRVAGARFTVAAFLNLGRDHLDFHGSPAAYFEAKALLFDRLRVGDTAVLSADDEAHTALAARTRGRVLTFGRSPGAAVWISSERSGLDGSALRLETPKGPLDLETPLPGPFNVMNAAAAAACALALEVPPDAVATGIARVARVPGRLEPVGSGQPFAVLVDYAHTEESLDAVLRAVRAITPGRLTVVFGCGGDRDRGKRPGMGRVAARLADRVVLTSDNPRSEDPEAILRDVAAGALSEGRSRVTTVSDRARAIATALGEAQAGDAVVIAGKGHETTQTFADRVEPFDDRDVARRVLADLGYAGGRRADA
ncbi:MAG TPA: UDP-N-acetylmuramoyl-L-alanyl-D-glutamate--2,6-diaminopimelate ligase [Candidatus Polarisedimenticolaceae bacterium]|nr:UDP-N-acetylmuramoyl-L-alanyl-D-glutamate--2,6-diaminopimelate ligase [Candidatus Polarisedimenticolaceae bacterium]